MAVLFGIVLGGLVGVPVGALIRAMRTRRFLGLLQGALCAAVPAPAMAVAVSLIFALLQMLLCQPGGKGFWDVPVWLISIEGVAILVASVVGAFLAQRSCRPTHPRRKLMPVLLGAVVGALAFIGPGFEGYYVLESNMGPISYAATGFIIGGFAVLLWRVISEALYRREEKAKSA